MDYRSHSSRAGFRPPSRYNPITGEEIQDVIHTERSSPARPRDYIDSSKKQSKQHKNERVTVAEVHTHRGSASSGPRPVGVPSLNLALEQDDDNDQTHYNGHYSCKIDTPNTSSTVSWGTPHSSYARSRHTGQVPQSNRQQTNHPPTTSLHLGYGDKHHNKTASRTAWDKPAVHEKSSPLSPFQQRNQFFEDMRLDLSKKFDGDVEDDDLKSRLQTDMTAKPYSKAQELKRTDLETLEEEKKKHKLIETVMIDQLSRAVISDPEQNSVYTQRKETYRPGMKRGTIRNLHHSKVITSGSATENLLSRKVRFDARIMTRHGRDAIRELTGFFFAVDKSLTVYEYRRFGKGHKAMPFLNRGVYRFLQGPRKDEPYSPSDIYQDATLQFLTRGQPIPDSLGSQSVVTLRITDIDERMRYDTLLENVPRVQREEVWELMQMPPTEEERKMANISSQVKSVIRSQLKNRAMKTLTGLYKYLERQDVSGDGCLNKYDFERALIEYHIDLTDQDFDELWEALDTSGSSFLDCDEFLRGFIGEMSEARHAPVRKAFLKLDHGRQGKVAIGDMKKFYRAKKHPKVQSGELLEEDVLSGFISSFEDTVEDNFVSYREFVIYYEGLSFGMEDDEAFVNVVKNAWGV